MMRTAALSALILLHGAALADAGSFKRSAAAQALYERAWKECKSSKYYPNRAIPFINYGQGWFRCFDYRSGKGRRR